MSAGTSDVGTRPVPSVPKQILRATASTFAVLLAGALVLGVVASWDRVTTLWYRVAGDPSIRLADGVVLSSAPETVAVPVVKVTTWPASQDVVRIAAATGRPVRAVDAATARQLLGAAGARYVEPGQRRVYATPLGIVTIVEFGAVPGPAVQGRALLFATPSTSAPMTASERAGLLRRLVVAWGAGASSAVPGAAVRVDPPSAMAAYGARVVAGPVVTGPGTAGWADFGSDGRLTMAAVPIARITGVTSVRVVSPAAAFDAVRHHAEGTEADPMTAASAHLVEEDVFDALPAPGDLMWTFSDAAGNDADFAPAGEAVS